MVPGEGRTCADDFVSQFPSEKAIPRNRMRFIEFTSLRNVYYTRSKIRENVWFVDWKKPGRGIIKVMKRLESTENHIPQ